MAHPPRFEFTSDARNTDLLPSKTASLTPASSIAVPSIRPRPAFLPPPARPARVLPQSQSTSLWAPQPARPGAACSENGTAPSTPLSSAGQPQESNHCPSLSAATSVRSTPPTAPIAAASEPVPEKLNPAAAVFKPVVPPPRSDQSPVDITSSDAKSPSVPQPDSNIAVPKPAEAARRKRDRSLITNVPIPLGPLFFLPFNPPCILPPGLGRGRGRGRPRGRKYMDACARSWARRQREQSGSADSTGPGRLCDDIPGDMTTSSYQPDFQAYTHPLPGSWSRWGNSAPWTSATPIGRGGISRGSVRGSSRGESDLVQTFDALGLGPQNELDGPNASDQAAPWSQPRQTTNSLEEPQMQTVPFPPSTLSLPSSSQQWHVQQPSGPTFSPLHLPCEPHPIHHPSPANATPFHVRFPTHPAHPAHPAHPLDAPSLHLPPLQQAREDQVGRGVLHHILITLDAEFSALLSQQANTTMPFGMRVQQYIDKTRAFTTISETARHCVKRSLGKHHREVQKRMGWELSQRDVGRLQHLEMVLLLLQAGATASWIPTSWQAGVMFAGWGMPMGGLGRGQFT